MAERTESAAGGTIQDRRRCAATERGRDDPSPTGAANSRGYASKRRKIATAFWPPKPKPLIATVSTFAVRATSGT